MKKGAGTDPFGRDDGDDESEAEEQLDADDEPDDPHTDFDVGNDDTTAEDDDDVDYYKNVDDEALSSTGIVPKIPHVGADDGGVPWVYTRSNVKQDRDMVQFYLRQFVQDAEDDFVDAVEGELGTSVSKTDVREAAYIASMRRPEIVADELERWGFEAE